MKSYVKKKSDLRHNFYRMQTGEMKIFSSDSGWQSKQNLTITQRLARGRVITNNLKMIFTLNFLANCNSRQGAPKYVCFATHTKTNTKEQKSKSTIYHSFNPPSNTTKTLLFSLNLCRHSTLTFSTKDCRTQCN